jgi:cyclase
MIARRIIPCLDIKDGRVVKGVRFVNLADAGDPVALARAYEDAGADELVFLDITATVEGRRATRSVVRAVAAELTIPAICCVPAATRCRSIAPPCAIRD